MQASTEPTAAHDALQELKHHFEGHELRWHLRDLLRMATQSREYQAMPMPEQQSLFNLTLILIDNLDEIV